MSDPIASSSATRNEWDWREWFGLLALVIAGAMICLTDSAWGLVVLLPALAVLGLGLGVAVRNRRLCA